MFKKLKIKIIDIHNSLIPSELDDDKRKKILFYFAFYSIITSTFLTVLSQLPMFTARGITQLFQFGWIISFIPLLMLDYKQVLRYLAFSVILIFPFLIYCSISLIFNIKSFEYGGTTYVFLCLFLLIIFGSFSKYRSKNSTKLVALSFLVSALLYALVVFFTKLRGQDISNQIYAFGDKNSAGLIFMSAAILGFYIFTKRNALHTILRWGIFVFFVFIIALSKTRSVLITIPIILFIFLFKDINNTKISFIALITFITAIILIFAVPYLRETIIVNILLNGKTDIDSIFSGRLTQIIVNMQNFKPILGTGGSYFDCMILSLLCSYGIIGFISLLPFLLFPFIVLFTYRKNCGNKKLKTLLVALIIVFLTSSLLEGFGYIGTGAKVFIFWFFVGNYSSDFFNGFKNNKIAQPFSKITSIINKTPKNAVIYTISSIILVLSIGGILINSIPYSIGKTIVDKLPSTNVIADYVEVKDIQIDAPVSSMCVGQKITYEAKATPTNAEDKSVYWSTGWIQNPCISVDGYTGEVTANRAGNALLLINRFRIGPNGVYIQYPVVEQTNYIFDKSYISTKQFFKSFEHTNSESISINEKCTQKIFYDNYYIPNESLIAFTSSDPDVAVVENGFIKAINPGDCIISATISGKETTQSVNHITVHVNESTFVPTTNISINPLLEYYQHQEYSFVPSFNEGASDTNFTIKINGVKNKIKNNRVTFIESGSATISLLSDNDPSVNISININIKENLPNHFECKATRMKIGDTKTFEELGIKLVFSNGYKKIVELTDIFFNPADMTNRAWSNQNGFVKDRTTVKAVLTGTIKIPLVCLLNKDITADFRLMSSIYTLDEYNAISNGAGIIAVSMIPVVLLAFSLFIPTKRRLILSIINTLYTSLFVALLIILYGLNTFSIISSSIVISILIMTFVIQLVLKKKIPLQFLEDPASISLYEEEKDCPGKLNNAISINI